MAVECAVVPVATEEGFVLTTLKEAISMNAPPFSRYCHCQPVIGTLMLFRVIVAEMLEATLPFSLFVLVSGLEVLIPERLMLREGATYAAGVMLRVVSEVAPTESPTMYR